MHELEQSHILNLTLELGNENIDSKEAGLRVIHKAQETYRNAFPIQLGEGQSRTAILVAQTQKDRGNYMRIG